MIFFGQKNARSLYLKIGTLVFKATKHRNIPKTHNNILSLHLVDENGEHISPYPLKKGKTTFYCLATFRDGNVESYAPYWLCCPKGSSSGTEVFGRLRSKTVTVTFEDNHERYTELSCWVYMPSSMESNVQIPHDSIGFLYPQN
jgi:hypothetical protein